MASLQNVALSQIPSNEMCVICWEPLSHEGEAVVQHTRTIKGEGAHAFHRNCLRSWMLIHPDCPLCRTSLDTSSLLSFWEAAAGKIKKHVVPQLLFSLKFSLNTIVVPIYAASTVLVLTRTPLVAKTVLFGTSGILAINELSDLLRGRNPFIR
jgi:hypothetical protein